jgi:CheY-like chemotaxis protein
MDVAARASEPSSGRSLLSDLRLPETDGFAFIRQLRTHRNPALAALPAASITASRRVEDRHQALAAGFQVHLEKPLDPDELVSTVLKLAASGRAYGGPTH